MKNIYSFSLFISLFLFNTSLFCQQDSCNKNIEQYTTGKDQITFCVLDCETNETVIGAEIYSFNLKKVLATTDIDGVAITSKELSGNIEVSYIAYYPICFKLDHESIDSVLLWMKSEPLNFGDGVVSLDTNTISEHEKGKIIAEQDLIQNKIQLLTKNQPTTEQSSFAKNHNFEFKIWQGNNTYREAYNEIVIDFLNNEFDSNIEEELREICWRNFQP